MVANTDFVGIAAAISATFAGLVSVIVAVRQTDTKAKVADIHDQVTTSNGETLAHIVEGNDLRGLEPNNPPPQP